MINKVILVGRLGKDPEVRHFENGGMVCNFTLATDESYKNREGQKVELTEWHNISIRRNGLAQVAEKYLKKGSLVYLEGRLKTRSWDDQQGQKKYITETVVDQMKMMGGRNENSGGGNYQQAAPAEQSKAADPQFEEDDLPF